VAEPRVKNKNGRKRNPGIRRSSLLAKEILEECGLQPLYVMLSNMKHAWEKAEAIEAEKVSKDPKVRAQQVKSSTAYRAMAQECAKDAAPYLYPKLQTVALGNDEENPLTQPEIQITFVRPDGTQTTNPREV